jgi:hypothetical protein
MKGEEKGQVGGGNVTKVSVLLLLSIHDSDDHLS